MNWKAGDIAIYEGPVLSERAIGLIASGDEITILDRNEMFPEYWRIDRVGRHGERVFVEEKYLKRKKPPASPFSFDEIISMCNEDLRPTETQVRESLKGILQPFDSITEREGEKANGS